MPNQETLAEIEIAELIQSVDDGRAANDPFKLQAGLRTLLDTRLTDLKAKDAATLTTEGGRAGAQINVRTALDTLNTLLHDGYNFIKGLPSYSITAAERATVFTSYGWVGGELGDFDDARIEALANQAATATPGIPNAAHRYPAQLLTLIAAQLAIVNANQPLATGGTAQAATAARDIALELLRTANDRVRFHYCASSDDEDKTPELAKIGKQPRRTAGEAQEQPLPGAPGTATFDAGALTLSVPTMPEHATSLRAYRKPAGGEPELAGTSAGTTVSVVGSGPLTPDVTYELWVVGHNFRGDGPESNHVSHTA
jgi:hypothetical protein